MGSNELVTELSAYTSGTLDYLSTSFNIDIELLTSDCMLLPIIATSGFTYFFEMCVLGHFVCCCNCNVMVD